MSTTDLSAAIADGIARAMRKMTDDEVSQIQLLPGFMDARVRARADQYMQQNPGASRLEAMRVASSEHGQRQVAAYERERAREFRFAATGGDVRKAESDGEEGHTGDGPENEEDQDLKCPSCGGEPMYAHPFGDRVAMRCRDCGLDYSTEKSIKAGNLVKGAPTLTREMAYAAGRDAGNRSMRAANRTAWNEDDYNAASAETNRLLAMLEEKSMKVGDIKKADGFGDDDPSDSWSNDGFGDDDPSDSWSKASAEDQYAHMTHLRAGKFDDADNCGFCRSYGYPTSDARDTAQALRGDGGSFRDGGKSMTIGDIAKGVIRKEDAADDPCLCALCRTPVWRISDGGKTTYQYGSKPSDNPYGPQGTSDDSRVERVKSAKVGDIKKADDAPDDGKSGLCDNCATGLMRAILAPHRSEDTATPGCPTCDTASVGKSAKAGTLRKDDAGTGSGGGGGGSALDSPCDNCTAQLRALIAPHRPGGAADESDLGTAKSVRAVKGVPLRKGARPKIGLRNRNAATILHTTERGMTVKGYSAREIATVLKAASSSGSPLAVCSTYVDFGIAKADKLIRDEAWPDTYTDAKTGDSWPPKKCDECGQREGHDDDCSKKDA